MISKVLDSPSSSLTEVEGAKEVMFGVMVFGAPGVGLSKVRKSALSLSVSMPLGDLPADSLVDGFGASPAVPYAT